MQLYLHGNPRGFTHCHGKGATRHVLGYTSEEDVKNGGQSCDRSYEWAVQSNSVRGHI